MMNSEKLKQEMRQTLEENILKYWIERMTDREHGGYYGRIDGHDKVDMTAEKGAVLNARILWTFSAAYRILQKSDYLTAATRAKNYIEEHFIDSQYGGVYWSLDDKGNPFDTKKQTYALGFTIYGLGEYVRATGDKSALELAVKLYHDIEEHAFDPVNNGYVEALARDWKPIADMRLSDKDENGSRTMNTHLHIIEPYTNLYRVWKTPELRESIVNLLDIFTEKLLNKQTRHLDLFFDDKWNGKRNIQSFGHDIETSWLLHETALVLGDAAILKKMEPIVVDIAKAADEGLQPDGSMAYERWTESGKTDNQRQWWVMCENIIGHVNLYQHFGDKEALGTALRCWNFVKNNLIDYENGEWHWGIDANGAVNYKDDKAGLWKCPYHNSRMCLELMERKY
ncbi:AGE family epimerase/isomerase [Prevotella sp. KH2C16]|uniref:AGE family epimerase/isomerase n=1 Tax=Prevotella sp. KH2C16 TaxID=1855325 RepID=UPI0008E21074|nr:mannobiose 2-epimerase [Prevotella sp. KH2C16]